MSTVDPHPYVDTRAKPVDAAPATPAAEALIATPRMARHRLDFLDALRGLAAVYVVVYHMVYIPEPDLKVPHWAAMVALNGGMGVTLFFVVSAFSLYYTMPLRLAEPRPWTSFFIHRFFRIAPLFYVWIALTMLRDARMFDLHHSAREVATSAAFVFNLLPQGQEGFVWAGWTIGIEMVFYALFPLFYLFAKNRVRVLTMALALLVGWFAVKGLAVYFTTDAKTLDMFSKWNFLRHLPVFACGAVAYHVFMHDHAGFEGAIDPPKPSIDGGLLMLALAIFLYVALLNGWLPNIFGDPYYWQAVLFTLLLLGLARAPLRLLVNRITGYLGRISYSLYLNHPTIVLLLAPVYVRIHSDLANSTLAFLACVAVTLAVCIVASELTYRLVEEPGIKLGKRLNRSMRDRARR